jgi:hypothetical protein
MPMTQGAAFGHRRIREIFETIASKSLKKSRATRAKDNHTALSYCIISQCCSCCPDMLTSPLDVLPIALRPVATVATVRPFVRYRYSRPRPEA